MAQSKKCVYLCCDFQTNNIVLFNLIKKMKKLFLSLAVIASVSLFSCGGNKAAEAEETQEPATEVVEEGAAVEEATECPDSCQAEGAAVEEAAATETPAAE